MYQALLLYSSDVVKGFVWFLRAHVAKFYGRLRLIRSVLRASNFPCLKFLEIVILWVYYAIPFGFTLFRHFWAYIFNFLKYVLRLRITDEGSVPEMRIWSISLIQYDLKLCIHLSRSLFFNSCMQMLTSLSGLDTKMD